MDLKRFTTVIITLAFSGALYAAEKNDGLLSNESNSILAEPFFNQSTLTLSLKNYWKYLKEENENPTRVHNAWGQGVTLDYQSGFLADIIGVDADYTRVVKLGASDYFNSRGVLYSQGSGNHKSDAGGYVKWGQRNLKLKYKLANTQYTLRWGWQAVKNNGVITSSTRLSPTTYLGWAGSANYKNLTLSGAWFERSLARNSPDKKRFQTNSGEEISYLASGDAVWRSDNLMLKYAYGESAHYLARHLFFADVTPAEHFTIGTQIYLTQARDRYRSMPANKRDFDSHAAHYALDVTWKGERWKSKWGIGFTQARKKNAVGFYPRHLSKYSRGTFSSMAYAGDDYMRDREIVLSNLIDYQITPDFSLGLTGNIAQFNYRHNAVRSGEINMFTHWQPFKELSIRAMAGPGWSYKSQGKTPRLENGSYQRTHTLASEMVVEYRFRLL